MEQQGLYKAALYCRLSQDDGSAGDSTSIQTQKAMLGKFCREQGFIVSDYYVDDGYSGVNFNRPNFQRLINDIDDKKINLVITKDLSRLGRDYIQTGYYTEIFFPERNIRYIAITDNVDTLRQDNDIAPFKNILNDMYSRDLSRKTKMAKRQRMLQGLYISGQRAYGYKQDPYNKNHLVIDEEPAEVVREIFRLAMTGIGTVAISKELKARKIIAPAFYKSKQGDKKFDWLTVGRQECDWSYGAILKIIRNRVYIGDMVNHKSEVKNYKTGKTTSVPKDQQIVVENTHEAIIDKSVFERVQDLVGCRHRTRKHNYPNIFKSILFCSECGRRLILGITKDKFYYNCQNHYLHPERCTHKHYVNYEGIYKIIFERLKEMFQSLESNIGLFRQMSDAAETQVQNVKALAEKARTEKRLQIIDRMIKRLYEDYVCDRLEMANYQKLLSGYQEEQKLLNEQVLAINTELLKETNRSENLCKLKEVAANFLDFKELTTNMLNQLIDRIEIGHIERIDGEKQQNINIVYRFIN